MSLPRLRTVALAVLASAAFASVAVVAQVAPDTPLPPGITDSLGSLADQPATHTGFVVDRSTLQGLLQQGGVGDQAVAAELNSISFDMYRYKEPAFYTPETMAQIVESFHRAGWKHLVNGNQTPANEAQPHSSITDVWLHFSGADIDHVTVMVRSTRQMNLVQVAGELRPLDLIHLSGHFGIPKVDPNAVMVPAPDGR